MRAASTDFINSAKFQADVTSFGGVKRLVTPGRSQAGFSNCSTPEVTVEAVEYKEGTMIYTRKFPGNPSMSDITLSRGVARGDSSFWDWLRIIIEGSGEYRADVMIKHFHRENTLTRPLPPNQGDENLTEIPINALPARTYHVKEAFPIRHKVAGDLDATASEISIMEIDLSYEHFEVQEHPVVG